jgi:5-methyltetrahydropteroyltriglutamate--homocysteine methyltransferase
MQRGAGIGVFSDGELRRGGWMTDMSDAVEGFVPAERVNIRWHGPNAAEHPSDAQVVGATLHQTHRLTAHESAFLRQHAPGPFKVTLPSPSVFMLLGYRPGLTDRFYATRLDLLRELGRITRAEIEALVAEGVPYVQLDAPQYSNYVDAERRETLRAAGIDPDEALEHAVEVDRACLDGLRGGSATIGFHICRGNRQSMWFAEGGYDPIAEKLFTSLPVDRFLLEYDTERAGSFEPLRFVPRGVTVVLGLVTTKDPTLESQDDLLRRIDEAARYVPMDDLAISPQCGFASTAVGNLLSEDDQRRKLELVVETARRAWGA